MTDSVSPFDKQIANRNYMSPLGFKLILTKTPKVDFLCQSANIPQISMGTAIQPTYLKDIPVPGDKVLYDDLKANDFELWPYDGIEILLQNIVVTHNLGTGIDLERLVVSLPFEHCEYEPEQFPGLIYHIKDPAVVFLIFASGKCVISGSKTFEDVELAIENISAQFEEFIDFVQVTP